MPGPLRRNADEILDALDDAGDRIRRGVGDRQRDQADAVRDRTDAVRSKDDDLADDGPGIDPTDRQTPGDSDPSGSGTTSDRTHTDDTPAEVLEVAQRIAHGHAFEKHVLVQGEYPYVRTRQHFINLIVEVMMKGEIGQMRGDRTAYWYDGTFIARDPRHEDHGSAFRPDKGIRYLFENLLEDE